MVTMEAPLGPLNLGHGSHCMGLHHVPIYNGVHYVDHSIDGHVCHILKWFMLAHHLRSTVICQCTIFLISFLFQVLIADICKN